MDKKIIIANWKMNPQKYKEAEKLALGTVSFSKGLKSVNIVICPPSIFAIPIRSKLKKPLPKNVFIGAQNSSSESEGSFTGQISAPMIKDGGLTHVIVGHSESRSMGESNELINKKILNLLKNKLIPVLCIGETDRDHNGFYLSFIKKQINECLHGVSKSQVKGIVFAYEPLWAIGSGSVRVATKDEFIEMSIFIKKTIADMYDNKIAHFIPILYGGSVSPENASSFLSAGGADGLLVGRDSLSVAKFSKIVGLAEKIK
jgi:triosephosphate isomerase